MKNIKLKPGEKINGEDCYVLNGETPISYDHNLWISKERWVIVKSSFTYGKTPDVSQQKKISDEQMATSLKDMGLEVNDENKKN